MKFQQILNKDEHFNESSAFQLMELIKDTRNHSNYKTCLISVTFNEKEVNDFIKEFDNEEEYL